MTEKEILQQQETNGQKVFYLIAVGMFYHAYGCGAFALARATGYSVLRKHRKQGDILTCGFPANQLETVFQRLVDELQSFNLSLSTPMDAMILIARIQRRLRDEQQQQEPQEESPRESATDYRKPSPRDAMPNS